MKQATVARKYLNPSVGADVQIKQEFRLLANLNHRNLVQLYELEIDNDGSSFTMELLDGIDIQSYAAKDLTKTKDLFVQVLEGCSALFERGLLHRDLKPSNILVVDGRVVILDFGLATVAAKSSPFALYGTPRYAAPEELMGGGATEASDLYSVAIIFAEIILGHPVKSFQSSDGVQLEKGCHSDTELIVTLNKLLSPDPEDRMSVTEALKNLGTKGVQVGKRAAFVGRKAEVRAAMATQGATLISGESGIGKSRFLEEVIGRYNRRNVPALTSVCRNWEKIGFQAVDEIIEGLQRLLTDNSSAILSAIEKHSLMQAFPVFQFGVCRVDADPKLKREAIISGLGKLFSQLRESTSYVLAIDDFQWADTESLALIKGLLGAGYLQGIPLYITCRKEDLESTNLLLEGVPCNRIELRPLSQDEAIELLGGETAKESYVNYFKNSIEGSPFYLTELLRIAQNTPEVLSDSSSGLIGVRLKSLPENLRPLVDIICLSYEPIPESLAMGVLGQGVSPYYDLLKLEKDSWVRSVVRSGNVLYEPFHSRVQSYIVASLGKKAETIHQSFAREIELVDSNNYESLTHHHELGGEVQRAAEAALSAGIEAQERLAFESSIGFFDRADRLGVFTDQQYHELKLRQAQILYNLGDCNRAAQVAESAPLGNYMSQNARTLLQANAWISSGKLEEGITALSTGIASAKFVRPGNKTLWIKLFIQMLVLRFSALKDEHTDAVQEDEKWIAEVYWSLGKLNMISVKHGTFFQLKALVHFIKLGDNRKAAPGLAVLSNVYSHLGLFESFAANCMAKASKVGEHYNDAFILGSCELWQTQQLLSAEQWPKAIEKATVAIDRMENQFYGLTWECTTVKNFLLMGLEKQGDFEELFIKTKNYIATAQVRNDYYAQTLFKLFDAFWGIEKRTLQETELIVNNIRADWVDNLFTIQHFYMVRVVVYCLLFYGEVERAFEELISVWPKIQQSDVLDVTSSELDALLMLGLTLLHAEKKGIESQRGAKLWRYLLRRLAKNRLQEAQAYRNYLLGIRGLQAGDPLASVLLVKSLTVFSKIGANVASMYSEYALGRKLQSAPFADKWLQMMAPLPNNCVGSSQIGLVHYS